MRLQVRVAALALCLAGIASAAAISAGQSHPDQHPLLSAPAFPATSNGSTHRPLVIWHGLGDMALSEGIVGLIDDIKVKYPGIFVYSVQIPLGGSLDAERKAGFFGKMEDQVQEGCEQIASIPELAKGFDAMGFSQGGLYLRSYAQFCNNPPVKNLITFGTPHYGISALLPCPTPPTLQCRLAARAAQTGIYTTWAQDHLVSAQYFRDVERLGQYAQVNTFLTRLNNETIPQGDDHSRAVAAAKGTGRLEGLENLVAVMFDADRESRLPSALVPCADLAETVSPAQSAHFWTYTPGNKTVLLPVRQQPLYTEDWIGLRTLDERGHVHFQHCPGEHMDLDSGKCVERVIDEWVGEKV